MKSFGFAIEGITQGIKEEKNMRIHLFFSIIALSISIMLSLSSLEWVLIILCIGGMLALELVNSALERVVDMVTKEYHPLAKQAKDMAAGAVFLYAIISVIIGLIIFMPKLISLINSTF
ncbi:diacylglycerol kinase family protein [Bacillus sp. cl95]|uniref:diacylglycerol kinase family protein n=1 Tax=unclassified Bacillus (in: firmicutes) TaxID=185979 RepID=UPI0008E64240|nr:undecaprenol kinase [Bacillus sp. UNCCL13]